MSDKVDVFENMKAMIVKEEVKITLSKPNAIEDLAAYIDYNDDYKLTKIGIAILEKMLDGEFVWAAINDRTQALCVKIKLKEPNNELGVDDL